MNEFAMAFAKFMWGIAIFYLGLTTGVASRSEVGKRADDVCSFCTVVAFALVIAAALTW
jgi:hypothetical protein